MVFATPIIELIFSLKYNIYTEYSHKHFLKILKITNFMNFLVQNVTLKYSKNVQNFFESENN